jgi:transposase
VADLVAQGKCLFYEFPSPSLKEPRDLLSLKRKLKKQDHAYSARIRNHVIAQHFPELDTYYRCGEGPSIVKWCIDPHELATLPFKDFAMMVSSRNGRITQQRRLEEIYRKARSSIGCRIHPQVAFEAKPLLGGLDQIRTMIRDTDARIAKICQRFPEYPFLLSIPGFGPDISAKVLGALGNPHRFENHRQVLKTAGLDLSADRSGKKQDVTPVISKRGKADLRYDLYQAALVATSRNHHFIDYFTQKLKGREKEKGIGTKMRVKLSAKMLLTLMKKKEVFDPGHLMN